MLLLGIDGGGTSTDVRLAGIGENVREARRYPASNVATHGPDASIAVLERAVDETLRAAGRARSSIGAAVLGLAGVDRSRERLAVERWLRDYLPGAATSVVKDVELVLAAGTVRNVGLAAVAGTGSVVVGRSPAGLVVQVGGWGPVVGDPGSGHAIGAAALRAVADHLDGIGPATSLTHVLPRTLELEEPRDLSTAFAGPADVAAVTPHVAAAAASGDAVAAEIVAAAGRGLAEQIVTAAERLKWQAGALPCALAGGVLEHVPSFRAAVLAAVAERGVVLDPVRVVEHPVSGAIILAARLVGAPSPQA